MPGFRKYFRIFIPLFIFAATLIFSTTAFGEKNFSASFLQIDTSSFPQAKLYLSVTDIENLPVVGLTSSNFKIFGDGTPISNFEAAPLVQSKEGIAIVLGIDTSGTMKGQPLENAKKAVSEFISRMDAADQAAIVTFDDKVAMASGFSSNREKLTRDVQKIQIAGNQTKLYDAIFESIRMTSVSGLPSRKTLVFLSDGKDEGSSATLEDCISKAINQDLQIYSIGYESVLTSVGKEFFKYLDRAAKVTNGAFLEAPRSSDLTRFYEKITLQLQNQYVVKLKNMNLPGDGREHEIKVDVNLEGSSHTARKSFTAPVTAEPAPAEPVKKESKKNNNTLFMALVGIFFLVSLALAYFIFKKKNEPEETGKGEISEETKEASQKAAPAEKSEAVKEPEKKRCPVCQRVMMENWTECLFCKKDAEAKGTAAPAGAGAAQGKIFGKLVVNNGSHKGKEFLLYNEKINIGAMQGNEIVIAEEAVSSSHCRIKFENKRAALMDLDSTNGTFVNGRKIDKMTLNHKDVIRLGNTELIYLENH